MSRPFQFFPQNPTRLSAHHICSAAAAVFISKAFPLASRPFRKPPKPSSTKNSASRFRVAEQFAQNHRALGMEGVREGLAVRDAGDVIPSFACAEDGDVHGTVVPSEKPCSPRRTRLRTEFPRTHNGSRKPLQSRTRVPIPQVGCETKSFYLQARACAIIPCRKKISGGPLAAADNSYRG
jgi:hypothetical protein